MRNLNTLIDNLLENPNLSEFVNSGSAEKEIDRIFDPQNWKEIGGIDSLRKFSSLMNRFISADIRTKVFTDLDPDKLYAFGELLIDRLKAEPVPELTALIHSFLDFFRFPELLRRIYDDKRWDGLILDSITGSNFNFSQLFNYRLSSNPSKNLFARIKGSEIEYHTWGRIAGMVDRFARALINLLGPEHKDRKVAFLMENSLDMVCLDLACLTTGIVNIMIPANSVPQHIEYILNKTEAGLIFVSDDKQLSKIRSIKSSLKKLELALLIEGTSADDWVLPIDDFNSRGEETEINLEAIRKSIKIDDVATIMFTSGTTGEPKGIVFTQLNIVYKRFCRALAIPGIGEDDRYLAYLPLYHTFGRYLEMTGAIFWNAEYYFMENPSVETMIHNFNLVRPTIFISIPKKWMQLYENIAGRADIELDDHDKILSAVKSVTGGELKWGLSAAGYLPPDIFKFFHTYGIELMSGFGMTEATGGITMTPPGKYKPNSLGKELPGIEIKIAPDGELLIKGSYVMKGYFGMPDDEVFVDGCWLPTGDVMKVDGDGFIEIVDRKKEIYKNIKGETIAPQKIENLFRDFEYIKQVFLAGDHRPFNTLLIYPNFEYEGVKFAEFSESELRDYFASAIVSVNNFLAPFERIVDYRIINRPLSNEFGELTPKGTYKRRVIEDNFHGVIEEMYAKAYTEVIVSGNRVRIPNWILQENGCLSSDIVPMPESITIPKLQVVLNIRRKKGEERVFQIGDYNYKIAQTVIDLQPFLTNPNYWLGNAELVEFSRNSIYQWARQTDCIDDVTFYSKATEKASTQKENEQMRKIFEAGERSLRGLHLAVSLLQSTRADDGFLAIQYLKIGLQNESSSVYKIIMNILMFPNLADSLTIRREMFKVAAEKFSSKDFKKVLQIYLSHNPDLLDSNLISKVIEMSRGLNNVIVIEDLLEIELNGIDSGADFHDSAAPTLLNLLAQYGIQHPTTYEHIRQTLVKHKLSDRLNKHSEHVSNSIKQMRHGFRLWLGVNQRVAVDSETNEEYSWEDVIITEDGIDDYERERIVEAIKTTAILREAIFLFSKGRLIRLDNILPGGVWISHLRSYHDKSVYRVTVQTRYYGSFEVVLNLNKNLSREDIDEEVNWLILAGSRFFLQELVEDFGGYWEEYDMWSSKFVPGDTVAKFIKREYRRSEESINVKLSHLWPFFVWNASAAYFNFWKLTGNKLMLADASPDNFIVPPHDYQTGTKVVSFSERRAYDLLQELFMNFYESYIIKIEQEYPFLEHESICNYVFSGLINSQGEAKGLKLLDELSSNLEQCTKYFDKEFLLTQLNDFISNIKENGFIPKQLYFAIKRFKRWMELNSEASLTAQAETLNELYSTYQLAELENSNPEVRTRFFSETVLRDAPEELQKAIKNLIKKQHNLELSKDEVLNLVSELVNEFNLTEKEHFFITRLSFPHLRPYDSAEIIRMKSEGFSQGNLVVQYEDYDGLPFYIRKPVSPKEISRLHQLFTETSLAVTFTPDHQFLVAISERGFIIGGLFYNFLDPETAYMDKIVVSNRYRRKGISEKLMSELFSRLKTEKVKNVTTGFFRPEYFYRFGFKIERKYSGLVKDLTEG